MNRLVSFIICVVVVSLVGMCNIQAQSKKWTLTECIEYAVKHNIEVKQSDNQIQSLKVQKNTLRNSFLPDLNAGASQNFTFGRSLNQNNTYENSNIQNSSFSVTTEIPIFAGFKEPFRPSCRRGEPGTDRKQPVAERGWSLFPDSSE